MGSRGELGTHCWAPGGTGREKATPMGPLLFSHPVTSPTPYADKLAVIRLRGPQLSASFRRIMR